MPRYILFHRESGIIMGDSADHNGVILETTPVEFAKAVEGVIGGLPPATYEETNRTDWLRTYDVYRADVNGSEAVPVVTDGTDSETIRAVLRDCEYETSVLVTYEIEEP